MEGSIDQSAGATVKSGAALEVGSSQRIASLTVEGGGIAYFAHIGGFLFGMLLIKLFANNVHDDYEASHRLPVY